MKSFTKSHILKSCSVEIISPRLVECTNGFEAVKPQQEKVSNLALSWKEESYNDHAIEESSVKYNSWDTGNREKEEAENLIMEAKAEAERIVSEAQKRAAEIIQEAEAERETIRKKVEQEVRDEVIPQARCEGYERGLKEAKEEAKRLRQQAKAYLELAQRALVDEFHRVDQELLSLVLKISEKIIRSALEFEPVRLLNIIRSLTLIPRAKESMRIYVSPQDWEWLNKLPEEDKPPYLIIVDESLRPGDTYLECEEGIFDARINSQLEKLEHIMREELTNGGLDGTGQKD